MAYGFNSIPKILFTASLVSSLYSIPAYADSGDTWTQFSTQHQDKVIFLKTGKSQGMLSTSDGPYPRTQSIQVINDSNPRFEITPPHNIRYGKYESETLSIPIKSSTEAQQLCDKLDFTKGHVASPAEYAEAARQALRQAKPYEVEGIYTLAERRALEEHLAKSASTIRREGWGTYSGLRAGSSAEESLAARTSVRSAETLETRVGSRAVVEEADDAVQRLRVTATEAEEAAAEKAVVRSRTIAAGAEAKLASKIVRGGVVLIGVDYLAAPFTQEEPLVSQVVKDIPVLKDVDKGLLEASRIIGKGYYCFIDFFSGHPCVK